MVKGNVFNLNDKVKIILDFFEQQHVFIGSWVALWEK
jgi:hypothetical protein